MQLHQTLEVMGQKPKNYMVLSIIEVLKAIKLNILLHKLILPRVSSGRDKHMTVTVWGVVNDAIM